MSDNNSASSANDQNVCISQNATANDGVVLASVTMFVCDNDDRVYYTLVCGFRYDCSDRSDEVFCEHPHCGGFQCRNKQCVPLSNRCDEIAHCVDSSDEVGCSDARKKCPTQT